MDALAELRARNARFAEAKRADPPVLPTLRTVIVTCADQRVDPAHVLGLELGDAAVIRNPGGRVTPASLQSLAVLASAVSTIDGDAGPFELVLMQHTDCGLSHLAEAGQTDALAAYFDVSAEELGSRSPGDPYGGVRADIEALAANPAVPGTLSVSGLVYEIASGRTELVERRAPLRDD